MIDVMNVIYVTYTFFSGIEQIILSPHLTEPKFISAMFDTK